MHREGWGSSLAHQDAAPTSHDAFQTQDQSYTSPTIVIPYSNALANAAGTEISLQNHPPARLDAIDHPLAVAASRGNMYAAVAGPHLDQTPQMGLGEHMQTQYMPDLGMPVDSGHFHSALIDHQGPVLASGQTLSNVGYADSNGARYMNQPLEKSATSPLASAMLGQYAPSQASPHSQIFKCKFCLLEFADRESRDKHSSSHTEPKPYRCTICGKQFAQAGLLNVHMRTHTGEKPYECSICSRRFSRSGNVITHMRVHQDKKPFGCSFCGKRFCQRVNMELHTRVHTGVKPYKCGACDRAFTSSSNMRRHWRQLHPEIPEPALRTLHLDKGHPEKASNSHLSRRGQLQLNAVTEIKTGGNVNRALNSQPPLQLQEPLELNVKREQQQYASMLLGDVNLPQQGAES